MPDPGAVERPWIEAYPPGVPPRYPIPDVALPRLLDDAARDFPLHVAMSFAKREWTWQELADLVAHAATVLGQASIRAGDRVGVLLPNIPAFPVVAFATWRLGATLVPIDPGDPDHEIARNLDAADCRVVVGTTTDLPRLTALRDASRHVDEVVVTAPHTWLPPVKRALLGLVGRRSGSYRRARPEDAVIDLDVAMSAAMPTRSSPGVMLEGSMPACVLFTGGTTGRRKGVVLSHRNLVSNAFQARLWLPDARAGHERILCALPFWHSYGLTLGMLVAALVAGTIVLPDDPDPAALAGLVAATRPTIVPGVPALFRAMMRDPKSAGHDLSSIRACVSGGAPLPAELAERFEQRTGGARLREGYGLSEAGPLTHANPIYGRQVAGSIGLPVTGTVAIVVDPDDPTRRVPTGQTGELAVHGPQVMLGYLDDPEATATVLRDGWLLTGDIVRCDADGVFTLVDRKRDVITTKGMHVYPREVEDVLARHPRVAEAAVVGVMGDDGDEVVVAHVVPLADHVLDPEDLVIHCRHELPAYAVPSVYDLRDTLPTTGLGKVLRRELRGGHQGGDAADGPRVEPTGTQAGERA